MDSHSLIRSSGNRSFPFDFAQSVTFFPPSADHSFTFHSFLSSADKHFFHPGRTGTPSFLYHTSFLKSCALNATMIVLRLIRIAPTAGLRMKPHLYNIPAAKGMARIL